MIILPQAPPPKQKPPAGQTKTFAFPLPLPKKTSCGPPQPAKPFFSDKTCWPPPPPPAPRPSLCPQQMGQVPPPPEMSSAGAFWPPTKTTYQDFGKCTPHKHNSLPHLSFPPARKPPPPPPLRFLPPTVFPPPPPPPPTPPPPPPPPPRGKGPPPRPSVFGTCLFFPLVPTPGRWWGFLTNTKKGPTPQKHTKLFPCVWKRWFLVLPKCVFPHTRPLFFSPPPNKNSFNN